MDFFAPKELASLETPCLIVDDAKLRRNVLRLQKRMDEVGIAVRPHLKTTKSIDIARIVLRDANGPVTVSTLREAEEFGNYGVKDILYAVGIDPTKLPRVGRIRQTGVDLSIIVDNLDAARAAAAFSRKTGDALPALIEIDVDGSRAGVPPEANERLLGIAAALSEGAHLRGVLAHAGGSYDARAISDVVAMAKREHAGILTAAGVLSQSGYPIAVRSVGSTPTAFMALDFRGITEVRAGVYTFFDLVMAGLGICTVEDIALSVLATVIGHQEEKSWTIIDAGWMALSRDRGTAEQATDQGYGIVCGANGNPFDDWIILQANQEHGIVGLRPGSSKVPPHLPVGSRVRILPNHACATAAQHSGYLVVDSSGRARAYWPRFNGW